MHHYDLSPTGGGASDVTAFRDLLAKPDCTEIRLKDLDDVGFDFAQETVVVSKPVTIAAHGRRVRIRGGGAWLETTAWDDPPTRRSMHSGAFKVSCQGPGAVSFDNIWFSEWRGEAIFAEACDGLNVNNCRFTHPIGGLVEGLRSQDGTKDVTNVNAIWAVGPACAGVFNATQNECDLLDYAPAFPLADDEQFAVCLGSRFRQISVTKNQIRGNDDGLEVIFNNLANDPSLRPQIQILGNVIELTQENRTMPPWNWYGSGAIQCCRNPGATVMLKDNTIRLRGEAGAGITLTGEHGPANPLIVSRNTLELAQHFAPLILGWSYPQMPIPGRYLTQPLGPLTGATIERDNKLSGHAQYGFFIQGQSPQAQTKSNEVSQDRTKFDLICVTDVFLDPNTSGNEIYGFDRSEVQDLGTGNIIHEPASPLGMEAQPSPAQPQPSPTPR